MRRAWGAGVVERVAYRLFKNYLMNSVFICVVILTKILESLCWQQDRSLIRHLSFRADLLYDLPMLLMLYIVVR